MFCFSKIAMSSIGSNLAQIMEPSIISKRLGIYIAKRSLLFLAPETSGVELVTTAVVLQQ